MNKRIQKKMDKKEMTELLKDIPVGYAKVIGNGSVYDNTGIKHGFNIGDIVKVIPSVLTEVFECVDEYGLNQSVVKNHLLLNLGGK